MTGIRFARDEKREARVALAQSFHNEGLRASEIAELLGVSRSSMTRYLREPVKRHRMPLGFRDRRLGERIFDACDPAYPQREEHAMSVLACLLKPNGIGAYKPRRERSSTMNAEQTQLLNEATGKAIASLVRIVEGDGAVEPDVQIRAAGAILDHAAFHAAQANAAGT